MNYPERRKLPVERLDFANLAQLTFRPPDDVRWPALRLAREVMEAGGLTGTIFNAAKETALDGFIEGHIRFTEMVEVVEATLSLTNIEQNDAAMTLDNVLRVDHLTRQATRQIIKEKAD